MPDSDPDVTVADAGPGREVTARLGDSGPTPELEGEAPEPAAAGRSLGRYLLLAKIGEGGMGEVHRAYDPQLRREVALKLVKTDRADATEQARLLREAQAMAQLSHPNVAAVHDAGEIEGQVFIALEYIEGPTLAGWLREREHTVPEILEVFAGAGRGLAAAHAVGLIHRDFKPANVLVPADGRPRVLDFGLARLAGVEESLDRTADATASGSDDRHELALPLTQAGIVMGTPPYMPPEQHWGTDPDVRWDVYAFCVALYEALYGRRPFHGVGIRELARAKLRGLPPPPAESKVPHWIHAILTDGMHPDIAARIPNMQTLLERLADDPARRRRRLRRMITTGAVGAGLAVVVGMVGLAADRPCDDGSERVEQIWSRARAGTIGEAFAATGLPYSGTAWERVREQLDEFGQAWAAQYQDACEATHVRNEQSEHLLDLRMDCLKRSERELKALLDVFEDPDETMVEHAHLAALGLAQPARCSDTAMLEAGIEPPADAEMAQSVAQLRDELAAAEALDRAGKYQQASQQLASLAAVVEQLDYAPVVAEVAHASGVNAGHLGDFDRAQGELERAYFLALRGNDRPRARSVALNLVDEVLGAGGESARAELWARHARAFLSVADLGRLEEARVFEAEGSVYSDGGELEQAREAFEKALDVFLSLGLDHDPRVVKVLGGLSQVAYADGRFDDSEDLARRAIAIREETFGPQHPAVADSLDDLGVSLLDGGRIEEGAAVIEDALRRRKEALGPDHPTVGLTMGNLALSRYKQKKYQEALDLYDEVLVRRSRAYGADSESVANVHNNMAACYQALGRHEEMLEALQKALRVEEQLRGRDHMDVALAYSNVGAGYATLERLEEAADFQQRAIDITERTVGPMHHRMVKFLGARGRALTRLGRHAEAVPMFERALAVALANEQPAKEVADRRWDLARALWEADSDRERAIGQAKMARAAWTLAGVPTKGVDAWLAERQ